MGEPCLKKLLGWGFPSGGFLFLSFSLQLDSKRPLWNKPIKTVNKPIKTVKVYTEILEAFQVWKVLVWGFWNSSVTKGISREEMWSQMKWCCPLWFLWRTRRSWPLTKHCLVFTAVTNLLLPSSLNGHCSSAFFTSSSYPVYLTYVDILQDSTLVTLYSCHTVLSLGNSN